MLEVQLIGALLLMCLVCTDNAIPISCFVNDPNDEELLDAINEELIPVDSQISGEAQVYYKMSNLAPILSELEDENYVMHREGIVHKIHYS